MWIRGWLLNACILATFVLIYSAGFAQTLFPLRFALLVLLAAALLALIWEGKVRLSRRVKLLCFCFLLACGSVYLIGQAIVDASLNDPLFRYTLLFPMAGLSGFILSRANKQGTVSRIYVLVSMFMGLLAVFERMSGSFLVASSYANAGRLIRDGSIRSIVFAEHPLVLSVLLVCALPFIAKVFPWQWARFSAYASVIAGIISTNSRGALVLIAGWVLIRLVIRFGLLRSGVTRVVKVFIGLVASVAFLGLMLGSGSEQLDSSSALDASAEYRTTLYTFAARSLVEQPFGWGVAGLPEGAYLAASYFGVLDISKTVDSELALTIFDFGWIGLAVFVVIVIGLLKPHRLFSNYGQSALLATASGLYLALHSWVGLGSFWWLIIGLAFGLKPADHPAEPIQSQRLETKAT